MNATYDQLRNVSAESLVTWVGVLEAGNGQYSEQDRRDPLSAQLALVQRDPKQMTMYSEVAAKYLPALVQLWRERDDVIGSAPMLINALSTTPYFARFLRSPAGEGLAAMQAHRVALCSSNSDTFTIDYMTEITQFLSTLFLLQGIDGVAEQDKATLLQDLPAWAARGRGRLLEETVERVTGMLSRDPLMLQMTGAVKEMIAGPLEKCGMQGCKKRKQRDGKDLLQCSRCKSAVYVCGLRANIVLLTRCNSSAMQLTKRRPGRRRTSSCVLRLRSEVEFSVVCTWPFASSMRTLLLRLSHPLRPRLARMASTNSALGLKDSTLLKTQGFIDGHWLDAKSGATISVTNPSTRQVLGTVPDMGLAETQDAISAAAKAFPSWSATTAKQRHDILMKLFALMNEHHEDLSRLITLENGKTFTEAKGENVYSASFVEWFAEEAVRTYGEHIPSPIRGVRNFTMKQPVGVVSILTPWNFPSAMITRKLGAALAAGCTAVIKPPPETPFSALALVELARRAGVPDGVINVVTTLKNVAEVGKELCESKIVKKVSFTGSTPVAKLLASMSASTLKKPVPPFCGLNKQLTSTGFPLKRAETRPSSCSTMQTWTRPWRVAALICKFRATGQTCVCANRIFVQSSAYAEFASRLAEKVAAFKVGDGFDESSTHGPLIHDRAVEKVQAHIADAVALGAQVLVGGSAIEGTSFFQPTIISDVPTTARLNSEETFGPLASLIKFETEEEVIRLANDTDVGLAGYFFSRDVGRVFRVAEKLEVGMVGVNTGLLSQAVIPFGGIKESGLGREGGHGIEEYLNTKLIVLGGL
ncbi:Succinic semialdehyde dehydrogenase [Mycena kentingensis (nom. inval.)]|nr:Succinic semialdehyde dehydrogenase [Mycena kentingensis (nom. inval.)]